MIYEQFRPPAHLRPFIENIWKSTIEPRDISGPHDILIPDGNTDIIFMAQGWYRRMWSDGRTEEIVDECSLVPAFSDPVHVFQEPGTSCFGLRLRPDALVTLTGAAVSEWNGRCVNLEQLVPELADRVMNSILAGKSDREVIGTIFSWIDQQALHLPSAGLVDHFIQYAVRTVGSGSIKAFADQQGVDPTTLQRRFKIASGLTPKQFARVVRMNAIMCELTAPDMELTSLAYHYGYFDQSHMIKEFRHFTGLTPTEFMERNLSIPQIAIRNHKARRAVYC